MNVIIENEELVSYEPEYKKNKDGTIIFRGIINVYTNDGMYSGEIKAKRLKKEKSVKSQEEM